MIRADVSIQSRTNLDFIICETYSTEAEYISSSIVTEKVLPDIAYVSATDPLQEAAGSALLVQRFYATLPRILCKSRPAIQTSLTLI